MASQWIRSMSGCLLASVLVRLCMASVLFTVIVIANGAKVNQKDILKLRERILEEIKRNPDRYDPLDADRIRRVGGDGRGGEGDEEDRERDWPVRRYLEWEGGSVEEALSTMKKTLAWRREEGMNHLTAGDFPCEFIAAVPIYLTQDRRGEPTFYVNLNVHGAYGSLQPLWYQFIYHNVDLVDRAVGSKGWYAFTDLSRVSVANFDLAHIYLFGRAGDRLPAGMQKMVIYNMSPFLVPTMNLILHSIFPARLSSLILVTRGVQTVYRYVRRRDLPVYAGGRRPRQPANALLGNNATELCRPIWEVARERKWSSADVRDFLERTREEIAANQNGSQSNSLSLNINFKN